MESTEPELSLFFAGTPSLLSVADGAAVRERFIQVLRTTRSHPRTAVLDLSAMPTANPGSLEELVLPLAQAISGGAFGPVTLVISTPDAGVSRFLDYMAVHNEVPLYLSTSPETVREARPSGVLTATDRETLDRLAYLGGRASASEFASAVGLEATAAGNRLVNLVRKGFLYRLPRPGREGDLFVDPRVATATPVATSPT